VAVRTDVWVYLIFRHCFGGIARTWTLGHSATIATLFHLRSVPPFRRPILSLTFPNELFSRFSSLSQTNSLHNHHHHHHSSSSSTIHPLYSYSRPSPAMFVAMFCHYCCCRLQAPPPLGFGNNISFKFASSHPHVFPKLHTYAHYTHLASLRLTSMTEQTKGNPLSHRCI